MQAEKRIDNKYLLGQIDIDVYPDLAEEFGVSKDPASFDLPTLVLFQQGKEIRRLPELIIKDGIKPTKTNAAKDTITRLGWNKKSVSLVQKKNLLLKTLLIHFILKVNCSKCVPIEKNCK
jgi:hypothetical protein